MRILLNLEINFLKNSFFLTAFSVFSAESLISALASLASVAVAVAAPSVSVSPSFYQQLVRQLLQ